MQTQQSFNVNGRRFRCHITERPFVNYNAEGFVTRMRNRQTDESAVAYLEGRFLSVAERTAAERNAGLCERWTATMHTAGGSISHTANDPTTAALAVLVSV